VPRPRSTMRKIRDILRLHLGEGLSRRKVGAATGLPFRPLLVLGVRDSLRRHCPPAG
jgi:hypothetical protein